MKNLLLVDFSNQLYKSCHINSSLSNTHVFTGGFFGFLLSLCKVITETKTTHVVICDDRKPYIRNSNLESYKKDRVKQSNEFSSNFNISKKQCIEFFSLMNIPVWSVQGYECDDVIAWAVSNLRNRFNEIVAMSNDSDLFQLFKYNNFKLHRGKKGIYTHSQFCVDFENITTDEYKLLLSIQGTHNNIPGIKGMGPVRTLKLIKNKKELDEFITIHKKVIEMNLELLTLPYPTFENRKELLEIKKHQFNYREVLKFLSKLDITLTSYIKNSFEQISEGYNG